MKFLAVADLHGNKDLAQNILKYALKYDVDFMIFAGDIAHLDQNFEVVGEVFKNFNRPKYFIPGNHDSVLTMQLLYDLFGFKSFHKSYFIKENFAFVGFGFANFGPFGLPESEFKSGLEQIFQKVKRKHPDLEIILVTHEHPREVKMDSFTPFLKGNKAIKDTILKFQPKLHFCGHVHEASNFEEYLGNTKIINVARFGKIVEL